MPHALAWLLPNQTTAPGPARCPREWFDGVNSHFSGSASPSSGSQTSPSSEYRTCYGGKWRGNQEFLLEYLVDTQPRFSRPELQEVVGLSRTIILSCNYEGEDAPSGFDGAPPCRSPPAQCAQRCSEASEDFCARCEGAQRSIDLPLCDILVCGKRH